MGSSFALPTCFLALLVIALSLITDGTQAESYNSNVLTERILANPYGRKRMSGLANRILSNGYGKKRSSDYDMLQKHMDLLGKRYVSVHNDYDDADEMDTGRMFTKPLTFLQKGLGKRRFKQNSRGYGK